MKTTSDVQPRLDGAVDDPGWRESLGLAEPHGIVQHVLERVRVGQADGELLLPVAGHLAGHREQRRGHVHLIAPGSAPDTYNEVPPSAQADSMSERSSGGLAGG